MEMQQVFGRRLEQLLLEKGISQGEFAEAVKCSRQSINFYILGKRNPDITLAAQMADYLGVSCDYLVGRSDIREDKSANLTANQLGLTDNLPNVNTANNMILIFCLFFKKLLQFWPYFRKIFA